MRKLSIATHAALVEAVGERYRSADRKSKGRVLDELVAVTGFNRKHAVRLLRKKRPLKARGFRIERRIYNEAGSRCLWFFGRLRSVSLRHDWLGRVLCAPLPTFRTRNEDPEGDGGLGLKPELGEPPVRLRDDLAAEIAPDEQENMTPEQDGHLHSLRRAVAMDQGNKDFLPDF